MAAALTLLLIGSLLLGVLCGEFKALIPQTIEALSGSCVTIPCSFEISNAHESNLDNTCKAIWKNKQETVVFGSNTPQHTTINGDLTKKDCTTTLYNMQPAYSNKYFFRVECNNALKYSFQTKVLHISVKADPPRPTLTPSTLKVKEGTSVTLTCSAPAPCLSHPPTLTWTPGLGDGQETLQDNQDKTKVKTSVVNFTASYHHQGKTMSCTATYNKQDGSTAAADSTSLTADISFAPQILPSSDCTKAADQLKCSCSTVGNPSPTLQWYLDGLPVNHSDKFVIINKHLHDTDLRSIITVNEPQERDLSSLLCRSSNSLGSASLCVNSLEPQTSAQRQDRVTLPIFITTIVALLVLVCALLIVNRAQRNHHILQKSQHAGETSRADMSQLLTRGVGNEVPNTTEEDIYVNTNTLRQADVAHPATIAEPNANLPSSGPNNSEAASKSSEQMNEEGNDVIYSTVNWKTTSKKGEDSVEMYQPGSFYLEEERRGGNVKKEVESEYAQVKFKDKSAMNT